MVEVHIFFLKTCKNKEKNNYNSHKISYCKEDKENESGK